MIAVDYHQVLDVDRRVNPPSRVDHSGNLPAGHVLAILRLRQEIERAQVVGEDRCFVAHSRPCGEREEPDRCSATEPFR